MDGDREFDLVVLGATGVSGKFVVEELACHGGSLKWAVAGRSRKKVLETVAEIAFVTGVELSQIGVIIVDVSDVPSITDMCLRTKLVVNCVGPYRFYGEKVVSSCVANGTHYVDICGEPQFLEEMQQKYFEEASAKDIYVIGACGFDSIPCDMGVEFLRQKFVGNDPLTSGCLNSVESFVELHMTENSKANFATWQSAIHSFSHASELKSLRMKLRQKVFHDGLTVFPYPLKPRPTLFKSEIINKWCLPFLGSDKSVVTRSQMYRKQYENEKPVQIQTYFGLSSLPYALFFVFMAGIFVFLAKFELGRSLLETYPGFFSCGLFTKDPPTRKQVTGGSFTLTLSGTGWSQREYENARRPDKKMVVKVTGPDPGYITTAICAVTAGKTVLDENERKKMAKGGGVLTPAAAFARTDFIQKLGDRGLVMTVVYESIPEQQ